MVIDKGRHSCGLLPFLLLSLSLIRSRCIHLVDVVRQLATSCLAFLLTSLCTYLFMYSCLYAWIYVRMYVTPHRRYLRVEFEDVILWRHLVATTWTGAGALRSRQMEGRVRDTNPPGRAFWKSKWKVGNSWTKPYQWALSGHCISMESFLEAYICIPPYIYIYMYTYIYGGIQIHTCTRAHVCTHTHTHARTHTHTHTHICGLWHFWVL